MRRASLEKKEKEKDYADQIILAQEEERNRLGRDLHDSIGGMLGTLYMRLQEIRLKTQDPELQAIQVLVHQGIQETRTLPQS